jgi:hypothetical protein
MDKDMNIVKKFLEAQDKKIHIYLQNYVHNRGCFFDRYEFCEEEAQGNILKNLNADFKSI